MTFSAFGLIYTIILAVQQIKAAYLWLRIWYERRNIKTIRQEANVRLDITSPDGQTSNLSGLGITRELDITAAKKSGLNFSLTESSPEANHRRLIRHKREESHSRVSRIVDFSHTVTQDHPTSQVLRHNQNAMRRPDSTFLYGRNIHDVSNVDSSYQRQEEVDNSIHNNDISVEEAFVNNKAKKKQKKTKNHNRIHAEPRQEPRLQYVETKKDIGASKLEGVSYTNDHRQPQQTNNNLYHSQKAKEIYEDYSTNNPLEAKDSSEKYPIKKKPKNHRDYPQQDPVRISNYNNDRNITFEIELARTMKIEL